MTLLDRKQILEAQDIEYREVIVPEWGGGTVRLCSLTALEREEWDAWLFSVKKADALTSRSRLLSMAIVDKDGNRLFTEADIKDLAKKNGKVISKLSYIAQMLSGMTNEAVQEAAQAFLAVKS